MDTALAAITNSVIPTTAAAVHQKTVQFSLMAITLQSRVGRESDE